MKECIDITNEYFENSSAGFGKIIKQNGYIDSLHQNEIAIAQWLISSLGGDIVLLNEKNIDNVKTLDFLWRDQYWDLKDVSSTKAVDNAVRKGLHQIKDNPGGIILDFGKISPSIKDVKRIIESRMRRGFPSSIDIIIISNNELFTVFRYKK